MNDWYIIYFHGANGEVVHVELSETPQHETAGRSVVGPVGEQEAKSALYSLHAPPSHGTETIAATETEEEDIPF